MQTYNEIVSFSLDGSGATASPSPLEADSNQERDSATRLRGNVFLHVLYMLTLFEVDRYTRLVH